MLKKIFGSFYKRWRRLVDSLTIEKEVLQSNQKVKVQLSFLVTFIDKHHQSLTTSVPRHKKCNLLCIYL